MKKYTLSDFVKSTDPDYDDLYEGKIAFGEGEISVRIQLDGCEVSDVEAFMNAFFADTEKFVQKAKDRITQKYLSAYNNNWRFGDDDEDDPTKPELTAEAFSKNLTANCISFLGNADVEVFFDDNDMFLGHSLMASDFDGEAFHYAEMFG
ncbi:DUF2262 domain-containing protein [Capnocytophaga sp.]|uniref:DUF2262 domain-containing protein n=1 Tax=Capnocytophaga sp. TaxID=44737 RepID=UPI0026DBB21C|nr:DUF2262 domain-containing protein [Capnocytophaga sp.]MDO5106089.1 DUF2262 domain-containing protein [Capnocytophaga sp.]